MPSRKRANFRGKRGVREIRAVESHAGCVGYTQMWGNHASDGKTRFAQIFHEMNDPGEGGLDLWCRAEAKAASLPPQSIIKHSRRCCGFETGRWKKKRSGRWIRSSVGPRYRLLLSQAKEQRTRGGIIGVSVWRSSGHVAPAIRVKWCTRLLQRPAGTGPGESHTRQLPSSQGWKTIDRKPGNIEPNCGRKIDSHAHTHVI